MTTQLLRCKVEIDLYHNVNDNPESHKVSKDQTHNITKINDNGKLRATL